MCQLDYFSLYHGLILSLCSELPQFLLRIHHLLPLVYPSSETSVPLSAAESPIGARRATFPAVVVPIMPRLPLSQSQMAPYGLRSQQCDFLCPQMLQLASYIGFLTCFNEDS